MQTTQIKKTDARNFNDYIIAVSSTAFVAAEAFSPRKFYYASSYGWRADFIDTSVSRAAFEKAIYEFIKRIKGKAK